MDNNTVQFFIKGHPECFCIFSNSVNAYIDFTAQILPGTEVEGYNVCKVIVIKKVAVDSQQIIVGAEYEGQLLQCSTFFFKDRFNPVSEMLLVAESEFDSVG